MEWDKFLLVPAILRKALVRMLGSRLFGCEFFCIWVLNRAEMWQVFDFVTAKGKSFVSGF